MQKLLLTMFTLIILTSQVFSNDFESIKYSNIKEKSKITYNSDTMKWNTNVNKKSDSYFTKVKGFGDYYDYLKANNDFAFTTNCEYEFINNGQLIGYSNKDFKFYSFVYNNDELVKNPLSIDEINSLFPDFRIIKLSDFSQGTNSMKIQKEVKHLKLIFINDIDLDMENYNFTTGNSAIKMYSLKGIIDVQKRGMIQLSKQDDIDKTYPWFILLVR